MKSTYSSLSNSGYTALFPSRNKEAEKKKASERMRKLWFNRCVVTSQYFYSSTDSTGIWEFQWILQELTGIPGFRRIPSESTGMGRNPSESTGMGRNLQELT